MDVGRTLTRFNFPQAEVFNPLGVLLAHHLTQLDEAQRNAAEAAEDNDASDNQPRPEVADAILATSVAGPAREPSGPESADDGEQEDGNGGPSDGVVVRNFRSTDPVLFSGNIPIDSIRVDFTAGNMRFTTESTIDVTFLDDTEEGSSGTREDRPPVAGTLAEDRVEFETSTSPERSLEGTIVAPITRSGLLTSSYRTAAGAPPRIEISQPEGSREPVELFGSITPGTSPTPIYHDPRPPFETDGRGRVVWSNSSEQARLRSRSSPPVQLRKSSSDETGIIREKENGEATGPGIETGVGNGQETGVGGTSAGVP